ncbi:DOT5 [Candida jiufengensis]|uniref:DOT5 n=1 Tax=Candida jiufengensis TaxID=497108 RepID=UPI002224FF59|nr:DOT5 [Candida jiufengensis]KAI5953177.1 DOT5 [Candida jiufengensis]
MSGLRRSSRVAAKPQPPKEEQPPTKKSKTSSTTSKTKKSQPPKEENKKDQEEEIIDESIVEIDNDSLTLEIGDKLPSLKLLNQNGEEIDLQYESKNHKFLVLFAYPKASTPGCTRQVCGFQSNLKFFQDNDAVIYGISSDSPKNQLNFIEKQHLEYDLISDPKKQIISILGAKKPGNGIKRSHWIFVDGILKIKSLQISPEQSIDGAKSEIEKILSSDKNGKNGKEKNGKEDDKEISGLEPKNEVHEEGGYKEDIEDEKHDPITTK